MFFCIDVDLMLETCRRAESGAGCIFYSEKKKGIWIKHFICLFTASGAAFKRIWSYSSDEGVETHTHTCVCVCVCVCVCSAMPWQPECVRERERDRRITVERERERKCDWQIKKKRRMFCLFCSDGEKMEEIKQFVVVEPHVWSSHVEQSGWIHLVLRFGIILSLNVEGRWKRYGVNVSVFVRCEDHVKGTSCQVRTFPSKCPQSC